MSFDLLLMHFISLQNICQALKQMRQKIQARTEPFQTQVSGNVSVLLLWYCLINAKPVNILLYQCIVFKIAFVIM